MTEGTQYTFMYMCIQISYFKVMNFDKILKLYCDTHLRKNI